MGIFGAMSTAVTGLRAQSYALENISGNIANSRTVGFKRTETNFIDLVPDDAAVRQISGSVNALSRSTNTVQGDIQNSSVGTHIAINGEGFFVVQPRVDTLDGLPVFSGVDNYTRRGDFELDKDGYLVNGAGYYIKGLALDPQTGNVTGTVPNIVRIENDFLPARQTTAIEYRANLPETPRTRNYDESDPSSALLPTAGWANTPNPAAGGNVLRSDVALFQDSSISGGALTIYDSNGSAVDLQLRWAKLTATDFSATPPVTQSTWGLFYKSNNADTGANTDVVWTRAGGDYTFDANGQLVSPTGTINLANVVIDGNPAGSFNLTHGVGGLSQQDVNDAGVAQIARLSQDGYAAGELQSIAITDQGRVQAIYSNGRNVDLAQIAVVTFNGANLLKKLDGGAFQATSESGEPVLTSSSNIVGQVLEGSNADIADEFTRLIVTQQAYAANTRIVTTSNDMLQEVINMVR